MSRCRRASRSPAQSSRLTLWRAGPPAPRATQCALSSSRQKVNARGPRRRYQKNVTNAPDTRLYTLIHRPMPTATDLDQLAVNTIRALSIDGVQRANSGHPGLPLGAAPMAYVLWTRFLRHNPRQPRWPDRDRFAFSAGHGSMLLYSLLYLTGYDLTLDDLKSFRQ